MYAASAEVMSKLWAAYIISFAVLWCLRCSFHDHRAARRSTRSAGSGTQMSDTRTSCNIAMMECYAIHVFSAEVVSKLRAACVVGFAVLWALRCSFHDPRAR